MCGKQDAGRADGLDPSLWIDRYGDVLYRFARSRLRDPQIAEDVVQETFLAALRAREQFAGRSSEQTWLVGILRRKIADHFRKSGRREETPERMAAQEFDSRGYWASGPKNWILDPAKVIENEEFWKTLDECVGRLPRAFADAFCLREHAEMSTEEICEVLDISASNLWTQLYRARMLLRRCLEENWFEPGERS